MKEDKEHIDIAVIAKYLAGEANDQEIREVNEWRENDDGNEKEFREFSRVWDLSMKKHLAGKIDIDEEWSMLDKKLIEKSSTSSTKIKFLGKITRLAAVFLIGLFTATLLYFLFQPFQQKVVADSHVKELLLPDGSRVSLNLDTKLKYPKSFGEKTREVKLINGEAYFQVEADKDKPFKVDAGKILVEVLGTSFNVSAFENNDKCEISVNSGKVFVKSKKDGDKKVILTAGEKAVYLKSTGEIKKMDETDVNFLSWKTKRIKFKDKKLSRVVQKLEEVYREDIIILNEDLNNCRLTATFEGQSLKEVLNVIEATLDISVERKDASIILKGEGCAGE